MSSLRIHVLTASFLSLLATASVFSTRAEGQELPFQHSVEVYRSEEGDVVAFSLRLEQPFLAEEFEKSNYLRLRSSDPQAYLIYPTQTKFHQKHAEFYGRLRGEGEVELDLSYETVSENVDGSRKVQVKEGKVTVTIPAAPATRREIGSNKIYLDWAKQQNIHFAKLLQYYPHETFFQYCLLQSRARYGVTPPTIPPQALNKSRLEEEIYEIFTGSLAIQESLQRQTFGGGGRPGDYNTHVSTLNAPSLRSLYYGKLLAEKQDAGIEPKVHELSRLVPADQYLFHFNSMQALGESVDLASQWGDNLLRLFTLQAQDNRLQQKVEEQLCIQREGLEQLFAGKAIRAVAMTGSDPYLLEGTDVTMLFDVTDVEAFEKRAEEWLDASRGENADLVEREFNYRGHTILARYTNDRRVSSFATRHENAFVFSNSHRAIRRVVDVAITQDMSLYHASDYRYVTTILPPSPDDDSGYFYVSEATIKRLVGPAAKISQKRRVQCFNNLIMQNNASLFFRLEYGRSPESLSEMIEKRFIDPQKIICPHGGSYAFNTEGDTCTCSLHNRLRYLTPNAELSILNVSKAEAAEYDRYKSRFEQFWRQAFDPFAVRITAARRFKLESCVLPFANSNLYDELKKKVDENAQPLDTARIAPSAVASLVMVPGRENTADFLRMIPGVAEVVKEDPTLTDLSWIGDRVSLHFCDGVVIFELDPTELKPLDIPLIGKASTTMQAAVGALLMSANMPVYATFDVENREKAERLLRQFSQQIFLKEGAIATLPANLDAYRLPDYKEHDIYVLRARVHVAVVRLHIALVGDQLVMTTKPEILREVIDASTAKPSDNPKMAHMLIRFNQRALKRLYDDVQLYWAEKSRLACHRNIISIYNFHKLYDAPIEKIAELSEAKYGIRHYCPDNGKYSFDHDHSQIVCSVHGNRELSRQNPGLDRESSFAKFIETLDEVVVSLRFEEDALIVTTEIERGAEPAGDE